MQKPCHDCPFLKDSLLSKTLDVERKEGIVHSIHNDKPFLCHKAAERLPIEAQTICIGSAILLEKEEGILSNCAYRIHARMGNLRPKQLDMESPVFDSFDEFVAQQ